MYSLLQTIESSQPVVRETRRPVKPGRFRTAWLFVGEGSHPIRPMLYSVLVHVAAAYALLTVPIPVVPTENLLEADLFSLDSPPARESASHISITDIASQIETALKRDVRRASPGVPRHPIVAPCCSRETIVSNPPIATNHIQTILQPDFADEPRLKKFIPLPNMVKLAPVLSDSSKQARAPSPSLPKALQRDLETMQSATVLPIPPAPILPAPPAPSTIPTSSTPNGPEASQERIPAGSGGRDPSDVLVLSSIPVPSSDVLPIPSGEARGHFVVIAPPSPDTAKLESEDATTPKINGADKTTETAHSRSVADPAKPPNPSELRVTISSGSSTRTANPFAGITIQGGEWSRDLHGASPPPKDARYHEPPISSYPLTVTSMGNSGGGLRDFGVFYNQSVYTDYFALKGTSNPYAPPFVLQFALMESPSAPGGDLTHPRPANEVLPKWPKEIAARYAGEMVVVYATIAEDGKVHDTRVLESPSADLNGPLLDALAQWTFRSAAINGQPATVKALLGVPIVPDE